MLDRTTSLVVIIASCIIIETSGLGIHIFGKKDGSTGKDNGLTEEGTQKDEQTPRPPLLSIPRPEDHPLHHNNDPNHPFNNLPNLGGTRSTIVATKTVYVEVTSTISQHPICIEAHGVKPPCLPHYNSAYGGFESGFGVYPENNFNGYNGGQFGFELGYNNGYFREGGQEIDKIQPTATVELLEPTRILGGVSETAPAPSEYQEEEQESVQEGETRNARYLKIHSATPSAPLKTEPEIEESSGTTDEVKERLLENLINRQPEFHYATKTLWVTKVQRYVDHKVTATLVVKNCIPNEFHFPFCKSTPPVHYEEVVHKPIVHKPVHHEPVVHKPVHHEQVVHKPVHVEPIHHEQPIVHKPVHETYYQEALHHNAHEYPKPIHTESQYISGHEVAYQGGGSLTGGLSSNFKETDGRPVNEPSS